MTEKHSLFLSATIYDKLLWLCSLGITIVELRKYWQCITYVEIEAYLFQAVQRFYRSNIIVLKQNKPWPVRKNSIHPKTSSTECERERMYSSYSTNNVDFFGQSYLELDVLKSRL